MINLADDTSNAPLILITNDDSIYAKGLRSLAEAMEGLGKRVVVAPDRPQSGKGHSVTIDVPLRFQPFDMGIPAVSAYTSNGTPVDCVKLGLKKILPHRPTLCVSGINHGANHSINTLYSGTMGAAIEAGMSGIASIGFSLLDQDKDANFETAKHYATLIAKKVLETPQPKNLILNVNIPALPLSQIKGIKICKQADATYLEHFEERNDLHHTPYYWLSGNLKNLDTAPETDIEALAEGYVSIVPVQFDLTNYAAIDNLKKWVF